VLVYANAFSQELKVVDALSDPKAQEINNLLVFNFKHSGLSDYPKINSEVVKISVQSVDRANSFRDSMEVVKNLNISCKNAIEFYQIAYNNMPTDHFIYPQSIKWIASSTPNNLYNLEYSILNLIPSSNRKLQKLLDLLFDLHSTLIERDTMVLVLKHITPNDSTIKIVQKRIINQAGTYTDHSTLSYSLRRIKFESSYGSEQDLAKVLEAKLGIQVLCNNSAQDLKYQFKLNIVNEKKDQVDVWLDCLKDQGIILEKKNKVDTYVKIE